MSDMSAARSNLRSHCSEKLVMAISLWVSMSQRVNCCDRRSFIHDVCFHRSFAFKHSFEKSITFLLLNTSKRIVPNMAFVWAPQVGEPVALLSIDWAMHGGYWIVNVVEGDDITITKHNKAFAGLTFDALLWLQQAAWLFFLSGLYSEYSSAPSARELQATSFWRLGCHDNCDYSKRLDFLSFPNTVCFANGELIRQCWCLPSSSNTRFAPDRLSLTVVMEPLWLC